MIPNISVSVWIPSAGIDVVPTQSNSLIVQLHLKTLINRWPIASHKIHQIFTSGRDYLLYFFGLNQRLTKMSFLNNFLFGLCWFICQFTTVYYCNFSHLITCHSAWHCPKKFLQSASNCFCDHNPFCHDFQLSNTAKKKKNEMETSRKAYEILCQFLHLHLDVVGVFRNTLLRPYYGWFD